MSKTKKKLIVALSAVLILALLAAGGVLIYFNFFYNDSPASSGVVGIVSDGWDTGDDKADSTNSSESSGVQIPGYSTAEMKAGEKSLHLSIGNPKANSCGFYATLKLSDGTVLYESELLEPGYGLTEIPLNKTLEKGEYNAVVEYKCVTLDEEHKPLNSAESAFILVVK